MPDNPQPRQPMPTLQMALQTFYFNGFQVGVTNSDMNIVAMLDNQPQVKFVMSFNTAKAFVESVRKAVDAIEEATNAKIISNEEVARMMQAQLKRSPKNEQ